MHAIKNARTAVSKRSPLNCETGTAGTEKETETETERERGRQTGRDRQTVGKSTKRVGVKEISPGGSFHSISMNSANVASAKTNQIQTADKSAIDVDDDAQSMRYTTSN